MKNPMILPLYLTRHFAMYMAGLMVALLGLMAVFDAIELLRQFSKSESMDGAAIGYLSLLKVPSNMMTIAPFILLYSAMFALIILDRRQELVAMRAAGASIWQILAPLMAAAFLAGWGLVFVLHPVAATAARHYQHYEEKYLKNEQHLITLLNQGLWLRQEHAREGESAPSYFLMHAEKVQLPKWDLTDVTVFFFGPNHEFLARADASTAKLMKGVWRIDYATVTRPGQDTVFVPRYDLPTTLTYQDLEERFSSPETVSFWQLPHFIQMLHKSGLPVVRMSIYYGSLIMLPFLLVALVLIAGAISFRPPRQGGQIALIVVGIAAGFLVFFMSNFLQALGSSGQIPILLAVTAPALLSIAAGIIPILMLEDG